MSTIHLPDDTSEPRAVHRRAYRFRRRSLESLFKSADSYLRCIARALMTPTSPRADAAPGTAVLRLVRPNRVKIKTTTRMFWRRFRLHLHLETPQPNGTTDVDVVIVREGKKHQGTRGSRACSGPSARTSWERRSPTASRPSKPATT